MAATTKRGLKMIMNRLQKTIDDPITSAEDRDKLQRLLAVKQETYDNLEA